MAKNKSKILAIDPGTRYMGVALLENGSIPYCGVKVIKNRRSPHENLWEARKVVLRMIKDFKPQVLAVEKTFFAQNRNTALLNVLVDEIKNMGKRKGLEVLSFAPSTVKKFICNNGRASKEELATVMVARYPELKVFLSQDRKWKEKYHQNMFDAVALATLAATKRTSSE